MLTPTDKILLLDLFTEILERNPKQDIDNLIYQLRPTVEEKKFLDAVSDLICD